MPSAPLSISTQSRNKLHTYIVELEANDDTRESDKENVNDDLSLSIHRLGSQNLHDDDLQKSSPQLPQLLPEKQCPQTPANRIPLADLIGNTEDAFNCDPKDTTPEDHIFWQHGPTPRSSIPSASAKSARRGKKRARSSSPASSSQNQESARFQAQETLDLKSLHESLKTPHNDPALDLWARYTDASLAKKDADGKPLPAFAHLMTSSPQTPSTTNSKDSGLRRSISCGTEWPASKAKRAKFKHEIAQGRVKDIFAASKTDIMASGKSKASKITLLMEKLHENSKKVPQIEVSAPSSSSPLPDRAGHSSLPFASPISKRTAAPQQNDGPRTNETTRQAVHDPHPQQGNDLDTLSSEFGDDDLALDLLEAVEQSAAQPALAALERQTPPSFARVHDGINPTHTERTEQRSGSQSSHRPWADIVPPPSKGHSDGGTREATGVMSGAFDDDDDDDNDDEFGDGSDDIGMMADLAARFDTQQTTYNPPPHPPLEHVMVQQDAACNTKLPPVQAENDEDVYDDDNDDDLWNQIGNGPLVLQQGNSVVTASQVRVIL